MKSNTLSRRQWLKAMGAMAAVAGLPDWMPRLVFAQPDAAPKNDVLVVVFLRGGADSLNMIVPYAEDAYYTARPHLAISRPDSSGSGPKTLDLDGFFGLHPALSPLLPIFQSGQMTAIHATGSPHKTHSHFEAMDHMERGTPGSHNLKAGWVTRHLTSLKPEIPTQAQDAIMQPAFIGGPSAAAMQSIIDYHLAGDSQFAAPMIQTLQSLYSLGKHAQTAIDVVAGMGHETSTPRYSAEYPQDDFALALRQTASLIRTQAGLKAVCIDLGGWDTHVNQGSVQGTQANLMAQLAAGLAAFHQDMGPDMDQVTVIVMSEFGRRLEENANRGTDHGHGGAMLIMSNHLKAGPVYTHWPGLTPGQGDLAVTIDYRDILSDLIAVRLKNPNTDTVFPGYRAQSPGLFRA